MSNRDKFKLLYSSVKSIPSYSRQINNFLRSYENSSIFKQVRNKYPRRKIKAYYPFEIMMSDTINYRSYGLPFNQNYKYIMVLIDVFSKRAFAAPMKRMRDFDAVVALETMIQDCPEIPKMIVTDSGTEYFNRKVKDLFDRKNIRHFSLGGPHKASVAERFIRTLKSRLEKHFWRIKKPKWIDVLPDFIDNYNNSYHRSIRMAPSQVSGNNRDEVFQNLYPHSKIKVKPRLTKGSLVRLRVNKDLFTKGYKRNWSLEIYRIKRVFADSQADYYEIEDLQGNSIKRKKYYWELNLVGSNDDN